MTSLIVIALQRANTGQKERLKENYGLQDENNVKIVKQVDNYFIKNNFMENDWTCNSLYF